MKRLILPALALLCAVACAPKQKAYLWNAENAILNEEVYAQQYALNKAEWDAAFEFLADPKSAELPAGTYNLTDRTYAKVQIADTRTAQNFEAHRKGIDLFYIVEGEELVNTCDPSEMTEPVAEYNETKDVILFKSSSNPQRHVVTKGKYIVLFPCDAHQPMLAPDGVPAPIHKIVVKLPYTQPE